MTPCNIAPSVNDHVHFFVTHFQRPSDAVTSSFYIAPSVNATLEFFNFEFKVLSNPYVNAHMW